MVYTGHTKEKKQKIRGNVLTSEVNSTNLVLAIKVLW